MVAQVFTVSFQGIEAVPVSVQVQLMNGLPMFNVVGLPDKTVAESRERIRASFAAMGLDLPLKRITVNLAPADLQKEGSHYDLPIALALLVSMGIISGEDLARYMVIGELNLDGKIARVVGGLPAAITANSLNLGLICPESCGAEASWAGNQLVVAARHILEIINHLNGRQLISPPPQQVPDKPKFSCDFAEVKGQGLAKRALEVAAAGSHNVLMIGPPGAGKSMLAARMPSILPPLSPAEALEVTMIQSLAGSTPASGLICQRPFRDPHHSASLPALVGGGIRCRPGEISLAHRGVLFLDELPEFSRQALEALRQPLETGKIMIARANAHVSYPARIQLIAAMNPCRCGYYGDKTRECPKVPRCALDYQGKLSGPLLDRFDIILNVPEVKATGLLSKEAVERSADIALRVSAARDYQHQRVRLLKDGDEGEVNAYLNNDILEKIAELTDQGRSLLARVMDSFRLSGRGYYRLLRVARTIADLEEAQTITHTHLAEAVSYRKIPIQAKTEL